MSLSENLNNYTFEIARQDVFEAKPGFWALTEDGKIIVAQKKKKLLILAANFIFPCIYFALPIRPDATVNVNTQHRGAMTAASKPVLLVCTRCTYNGGA